jgi:hypothetical protein
MGRFAGDHLLKKKIVLTCFASAFLKDAKTCVCGGQKIDDNRDMDKLLNG